MWQIIDVRKNIKCDRQLNSEIKSSSLHELIEMRFLLLTPGYKRDFLNSLS